MFYAEFMLNHGYFLRNLAGFKTVSCKKNGFCRIFYGILALYAENLAESCGNPLGSCKKLGILVPDVKNNCFYH